MCSLTKECVLLLQAGVHIGGGNAVGVRLYRCLRALLQVSFVVYTGLFCCVYRPLLLCMQASFAVYTGLFCCVCKTLLLTVIGRCLRSLLYCSLASQRVPLLQITTECVLLISNVFS
jgi:hypothetical protein